MSRLRLFSIASLTALASACSQSESVECGPDVYCPPGFQCIAELSYCINPLETLCGNGIKEDNEECDDGNFTNGDGCSWNCKKPFCGDRLIDTYDRDGVTFTEVCDDGVDTATGLPRSGDGCSDKCDSKEICGDFVRNTVPYPKRDAQGNIIPGEFNPAEECDEGGVDTVGCNANCTVGRCGDGILNTARNETCDPNTGTDPGVADRTKAVNHTRECNDDCTPAGCGDGKENPVALEQCDLGSYCADRTTRCTTAADCPAGLPDQLCIPRDIDCCTAGCQDARCGDRVTQRLACGDLEAEVCDDGRYCEDGTTRCLVDADCPGAGANRCRTRNNAACSQDCKSVGECGDKYINAYPPYNEICDDGKVCADLTTACTSDAQCASQAGGDKTCAKRNTPACNASCKSTGVCGDGILNNYPPYNEVCDDGRKCADGTPCDDQTPCLGGGLCIKREGFGCSLNCLSNEECGDKIVNNYNHAMVAQGFWRGRVATVDGLPTTSYDINPGTAIVDAERCDDGKHCSDGTECEDNADCAEIPGGDGLCKPRNGDGCSQDCLSEERCGDGYLSDYPGLTAGGEARIAELCDDGNNANDDGCNSTCTSSGVCGNAILDPGEDCDYGIAFNGIGAPPPPDSPFCLPGAIGGQQACTDPCNRECTLSQCGNGRRDPGEECDDGKHCTNGNQACNDDADCPNQLAGSCQKRDTDNCTNTCRFNTCGDRIRNLVGGFTGLDPNNLPASPLPVQQCDEGGTNVATCNFDCTVPVCGDGITNFLFGETCDNGAGATAGVTTESATCNTNCQIAFCGDGVTNVTRGEVCDDADNTDGDGCAGNCLSAEVCGDGVANRYDITIRDANNQVVSVRPPEVCDAGKRCSNNTATKCSTNAQCGAGTCIAVAGLGCSTDCQSNERCGDRYLNNYAPYNETCDDGNTNVNDGCSATCGTETGWSCPTRVVNLVGGVSYTTTDRCTEVCGDGLVAGDETCDNGKHCANGTSCTADAQCAGIGNGLCQARSADGCSATCRIERGWRCTVTAVGGGALHQTGGACTPICGDREMWGNEQCDDGNLTNDDGCSSTCTRENGFTCPGVTGQEAGACQSNCGDGFIRGFEECDDDNNTSGDGCSANCRVELGWICPERGDPEEGQLCVADCGDFVIRGTEQCDDGRQCLNTVTNARTPCSQNSDCTGIGDGLCITRDGDGCSATCRFEDGYACPAGLEVIGGECVAVCGDGLVRGGETCDDGGTTSGDGCDSGCRAEVGWTCPINVGVNGAGGVCVPTCADGLIRGNETCDEGSGASAALGVTGGCLACVQQAGWVCPTALLSGGNCASRCGDGIRVTTARPGFTQNNEECDAGNANSNSGDCTLTCKVATCSDGFRNFSGTHVETDIDCGGTCRSLAVPQRCALNKGCATNADCQTNYCDPVGGICTAPPLPAPTVNVLEGNSLSINIVNVLFGGNNTIDLNSFEIVNNATTSACGGTVDFNRVVNATTVFYTPIAANLATPGPNCVVGTNAPYTDKFSYRVCAIGGTPCFTSTATVVINRKPVLADASRCLPINTPNVTLDVATLYTDADAHPINAASITNTGNGGTHSRNGTVITFTPTAPAAAASFSVALNACDTSVTPGCDPATWSLQWNDPPVVAGRTGGARINVFTNESATAVPLYVAADRIVTNNGTVNNAISSVTVGAFAGGPFGATTTTARGSCTITNDTVVYTAGTTLGNDSCFVRVCEGCSGNDVCSVAEIQYKVAALPVANDDQVFALEAANPVTTGATGTFTVASLATNDTPAGLVNFAFAGANPGTTTCNGTVVNNAGTITYTGPSNLAGNSPCRTADTFTYRACSPDITTRCDDAIVNIEVNRRPVLADTFTCSPINTPNRSVNIADLFTDADNDLLVASSITATGNNGTSSRVNTVVTWTPTNAATATTYTINLNACDDGGVPGCDPAVWTAVWNDPPVLRVFPDNTPTAVVRTEQATFPISTGGTPIIVSTGAVTGVQAGNAIASTAVGATSIGPFSQSVTSGLGGTCEIVGGTDVRFTAGNTAGNDSCFVQVCEACSGNNVCAVTRIPFKVISAPAPVADSVQAAEGSDNIARGTFAISTLTANDLNINTGSFALKNGTGTPSCAGAAVTINGSNVQYVGPAIAGCANTDSFVYTVCSPDIPGRCADATVTVDINRKPALAAGFTCMPQGSTRGTYTVGPPNFTDSDGDGVGTVTASPQAGNPGLATVAAAVVTWAPDNRDLARYYDINVNACDNASNPACTTGTWRASWNDQPNLSSTFTLGCASPESGVICLGTGENITLPLEDAGANKLITNFGAVTGVPDGQNPIGAVTITANGSFGTCTVVTTNGAPSGIRYTANAAPTPVETPDTCTVQVCEACNGGNVCRSQVVSFRVFVAAVAGDDEFGVLSTSVANPTLNVTRNFLTANDSNVVESTFALVSGTTSCGGTVTVTGNVNNPTGVDYVKPNDAALAAPACNYLDTFQYRVNKTGQGGTVTATVRIYVNRPPTLTFNDANSFVCKPVGSANHTIDLLTGVPVIYADPNDGTSTLSALTATVVGATGTTTTSVANRTVQLTPNNVNTGLRYQVTVNATDNALSNAANNSRGTATGTWNSVWNDPPVFKVVAAVPVGVGQSATAVPFASIVDTFGAVNGLPVGSAATPWASVQVGAVVGGPFAASADLGGGSSCAVSGSLDTSSITFTAGAAGGTKSCFVQVCEVCGATPVCAVKEIQYTLVEAVDDAKAAAEQVALVLDVGDDLINNDINVAEATFTLLDALNNPVTSTNTSDGGTVSYDNVAGTVTYQSKASPAATDTFRYRICATGGTGCDTATVTVTVNRKPLLAAAQSCVGLGTANVSFDLNPANNPTFTDPENHTLASVTLGSVTVTAGASTGGVLSAGTPPNELTFTPNAGQEGIASSYSVGYTAVDSGTPAASRAGTWTVLYNDPPTFKASPAFTTSLSKTINIATGAPAENIINNFGAVDGGITSIQVSATSGAGFAASANLTNGTCAVVGNTVVFTGNSNNGTANCFVKVCECGNACAEVSVAFTKVECTASTDCSSHPNGAVCNLGTNTCGCNDSLDCGVTTFCGAGNICREPWPITYCKLQHPPTLTTAASVVSTIYTRFLAVGLTDQTPGAAENPPDPRGLIRVQAGRGPSNTAPDGAWTWFGNGTVNASASLAGGELNDEWQSSLTAPGAAGTYDYATRVSGDGGVTWLYCDTDGRVLGATDAPDNYLPATAGKGTVTP